MLQGIKNFSEKIKYGAALLNWFADSLASLPLPPISKTDSGKPEGEERPAKLPNANGTNVPEKQVL